MKTSQTHVSWIFQFRLLALLVSDVEVMASLRVVVEDIEVSSARNWVTLSSHFPRCCPG